MKPTTYTRHFICEHCLKALTLKSDRDDLDAKQREHVEKCEKKRK